MQTDYTTEDKEWEVIIVFYGRMDNLKTSTISTKNEGVEQRSIKFFLIKMFNSKYFNILVLVLEFLLE